ncbi:hypothetical protein WJX79_002203 [Trebouxia sp. C0005]
MLPQLPTLDKLAQLSLEEWWALVGNELTALLQSRQWAQAQVGRLEGLESEVDQLQNVLQSVASELESGHQQAQMMQRRTAAAEHSLKKAELRVRSAELRAQSAESELAQLRKAHTQQTKHQGSPWKSPGLKSSSPRVSRLPGFEPRLLEPEELAWDSSSDVPPSASSPFVGHDDTSSEAQAAPKEAYSESGASSQVESAGGSHGAQVKKSKGSAQMQAGSNRGSPQGSGLQRGESGWGCAASAARRGVAKGLNTATAHPLHPKTLPDPRFNSPARSLPPHLRSYRNFTQTALLAMNSSHPEEVLPESLDQIPALGRRIPARRSSSMIRGSKPPKERGLTKPRPASVQPVLRQSCVPRTALAAGKSTPRGTYGMDSAFLAAKQQYEEQTAGSSQGDLTEHDRTQNWLKNLTTNKAKQASDPKRVDQLVGELQRLMQKNGLDMPLQKSGPCQYRLGSCKLSLKVGSNRLLVRRGTFWLSLPMVHVAPTTKATRVHPAAAAPSSATVAALQPIVQGDASQPMTPVATSTPNATATPVATKTPVATTTPAPTPVTIVTSGSLCSETYPSVPFGYVDSTGAKTAALTFDDGPDGDGHTDAVLDALKAAGVKATFFVNANNYCDVTTAPCKATLARISAEGHTVADHMYDHPHLDTLTNAQIATEFSSVNADVGQAMTMYRMPYGEPFQDPSTPMCGPGNTPCGAAEIARVASVTTQFGVHVGWTFDGEDYNCADNSACVTAAYSPFYNSGSTGVILHHSVYGGTASALPAELTLAKSNGHTHKAH